VTSATVLLCDVPALRVGYFKITVSYVSLSFGHRISIGDLFFNYRINFAIIGISWVSFGTFKVNVTTDRDVIDPICIFDHKIRTIPLSNSFNFILCPFISSNFSFKFFQVLESHTGFLSHPFAAERISNHVLLSSAIWNSDSDILVTGLGFEFRQHALLVCCLGSSQSFALVHSDTVLTCNVSKLVDRIRDSFQVCVHSETCSAAGYGCLEVMGLHPESTINYNALVDVNSKRFSGGLLRLNVSVFVQNIDNLNISIEVPAFNLIVPCQNFQSTLNFFCTTSVKEEEDNVTPAIDVLVVTSAGNLRKILNQTTFIPPPIIVLTSCLGIASSFSSFSLTLSGKGLASLSLSDTVIQTAFNVVAHKVELINDTTIVCDFPKLLGHDRNTTISIISSELSISSEFNVQIHRIHIINSVQPSVIFASTWTVVEIKSEDEFQFSNVFSCKVGNNEYPAASTTHQSVTCNIYSASYGLNDIQILELSGNIIALGGSVIVTSDSVSTSSIIIDISPENGNQGDVVTIRGLGFPISQAFCFFGSYAVPATMTMQDGTAVACQVPSQIDSSSATVQMNVGIKTLSGDVLATSTHGVQFAYIPVPAVLHVQPSVGLDIGGLLVTVFGSNFVRGAGLQCRFGADAVVSAVFRSSGQLECVQPAISAGNTSVAVSIDEINWSREMSVLQVLPSPEIVGISPLVVTASSEVQISVFGVGFRDGMECGTLEMRPMLVLNSSSAICFMSRVSDVFGGTVQTIEIFVQGVRVCRNAPTQFSVLSIPSVSRVFIRPSHGSVAGGNIVTLSGNNFGSLSAVQFGDQIAEIVGSPDANSLLTAVPASPHGTPTVVNVVLPQVSWLVDELVYSYISTCFIKSIYPTSGSTKGGTRVSVFGSGFSLQSICFFGESMGTMTVFNASFATCLSPPGPFGRAELQVRGGVEGSSHSCLANNAFFTYSMMPEVLSIQPTLGYSIGGLYLVVNFAWLGVNSESSPSCGCYFGDVWVTAIVKNSSQVSCLVPPKQTEGTSDSIRVSIEGASSAVKQSIFFTYVLLPEILSVQPLDVVVNSTASITLFGNKIGSRVSWCKWSGHMNALPSRRVDENTITCPGTIAFSGLFFPQISCNLVQWVSINFGVLSREGFVIVSIEPTVCIVGAKATLIIQGSGFASSNQGQSCRIGGVVGFAVVDSDAIMRCIDFIFPNPGNFSVEVSAHGGVVGNTSVSIMVVSQPSVTSIIPHAVVGSSPVALTVFGVGFYLPRDLLRLRIGSQLAAGHVIDDHTIVAVYHPPQGQNIEHAALETNGTRLGGSFLLRILSFAVNSNPNLSPAYGCGIVGTEIRVALNTSTARSTGANILCKIGSGDASPAVVTLDVVTCTFSQNESSAVVMVNILAAFPSQPSIVLASSPYSVISRPNITSISPAFISCSSDRILSVCFSQNVSHFPYVTCRFGSSDNSLSVAVLTVNACVKCVVPSGLIGNLTVSASFNGVDFSSAYQTIYVGDSTRALWAAPTIVSASGGSTITISGTGFNSDQLYECVDSAGVSVIASVTSATVLLCDVPALRVGVFMIKLRLISNVQTNGIGFFQIEYKIAFDFLSISSATKYGIVTIKVLLNRPITSPICVFSNSLKIRASYSLPSNYLSCSFPVSLFGQTLFVFEQSTSLARQVDFDLISPAISQ
jgi:hypothetical protein